MGEQCKTNPGDFAEYLQSVIKLDALEKMTNELDRELEDSQKIMSEIRSMYDSVSTVMENTEGHASDEQRHENISKFLEAEVPKLLMPDMSEDTMDIDMDDAISSLKSYAERLKDSLVVLDQQPPKPTGAVDLDLDQYAQSLDQLGKRLANIKLNKHDNVNLKNAVDAKLQQMCEDVEMFMKLIDSKKTLSESNKNWPESRQGGYEMQYDNIVKKLISDLNEVIYLLQNKI